MRLIEIDLKDEFFIFFLNSQINLFIFRNYEKVASLLALCKVKKREKQSAESEGHMRCCDTAL